MLATCAPAENPLAIKPLPVPDPFPTVFGDQPNSKHIANYTIRASYQIATHTISAQQTLSWTHTGTAQVRRLPFHLYLNAFSGPNTQFMMDRGSRYRTDDRKPSDWGGIEITSISIAGTDLTDTIRYSDADKTVLEVPLSEPIDPGSTVIVEIAFAATLPKAIARTGWVDDFALVAQWFPKVGVLTEQDGAQTWACDPFVGNNEFFADFGTYDVELEVPSTHVVAATGTLLLARDQGDRRTLRYHAADVHDFAWMIDPHMKMLKGAAQTALGQVETRVYFREEQEAFAQRHLAAAIGAIEFYSKRYLPYPWPVMSVVDPPPEAHAVEGMEYPTFITTGADALLTSHAAVRIPEFVTIHEVGHNWFQGIIASNEVAEPWLDEGINEYSNGLALKDIYGDSKIVAGLGGDIDFFQQSSLQANQARTSSSLSESAHTVEPGQYGPTVYRTPVAALATLAHVVGPDRFSVAMTEYANRYAFRHPTTDDFISSLELSLNESLDWFFVPLLSGPAWADFRVRDVTCHRQRDNSDKPWRCRVVIANVGELRLPVEILVQFADGKRETMVWDRHQQTTSWKRYNLESTDAISYVEIDPNYLLLLNRRSSMSSFRWRPSSRAATAYARRHRFWVQGALQVFGL